MDNTGMSEKAKAIQAGFMNALAGEAAPDDLQGPGYGEPAHPYYDDYNYRHGYDIGTFVREQHTAQRQREHQISNR